jgi:hypothetical protein
VKNKGKMKRKYVCGTCGGPVTRRGSEGGLGTLTCPKHPKRSVTVTKDLSGGQENGKERRQVPISVQRSTLVRVEFSE